jgi:hypothetical protein
MVKIVEKPLDRLDPMFREAPVRFAPKKPEHEAISIEHAATTSQADSDPKLSAGGDVQPRIGGRSV